MGGQMVVVRERRVVDSMGVQGLAVKSRPNPGVGQEHSPENYPVDQTTQPYKPTTMTEVEDHFGLGRTEWMKGGRS
jgi:hypothetical protein